MGPPKERRPEGGKVRKDSYRTQAQKGYLAREKKGAGKRGEKRQGGQQLDQINQSF